jgi:hypothetical protein
LLLYKNENLPEKLGAYTTLAVEMNCHMTNKISIDYLMKTEYVTGTSIDINGGLF